MFYFQKTKKEFSSIFFCIASPKLPRPKFILSNLRGLVSDPTYGVIVAGSGAGPGVIASKFALAGWKTPGRRNAPEVWYVR